MGESKRGGEKCGERAGQSGRAGNHSGRFAEDGEARSAGGDGRQQFEENR